MKFSLCLYRGVNWPRHGRCGRKPPSTGRIGWGSRIGALATLRTREISVSESGEPSFRSLDRRPAETPCCLHVHAAVVDEDDFLGTHDLCRATAEFGGRLHQPNVRRTAAREP